VGRLAEPEVVTRDGATDLDIDFRFPMPDEVSEHATTLREVLATLHSQARAGIPLTSSIGWKEDTGERDVPGGADWLEASIVGIPSDPRTTTADAGEPALARAVAAASDGFDPETFVREYRVVAADRNVVEVGGEEIDLTPPDAVQNAATVALAKDDELEPDCGTGAGRQSAQQIAGADVTAERIDDIAAYLTSHEEDVTAEGPPTDWSDEEWADCGNIQYALWGGTGTGPGLEWAQRKANEVARAQDEDEPYPERMTTHNLDDPEFGENDAVEWSSNDVTVRGRVADVGDEFTPAEGVTITGEEGEAVYLINELDDSLEPPQYRRENVAKPESSLNESQADLPPLDGNFADEEQSMTDDTDTGDDEAGTEREEPTLRDMEAKMDEVREMCERMDKRMEEVHQEMMGDSDEEEAADDGGDEGEDGDDDDERTVTVDGEERSVGAIREQVTQLRDALEDADLADAKTRDFAEGDDEDSDDNEPRGFAAIAAKED